MSAPTPAQAADAGPQELPFPSAPIEELLRLLVKAVRAHQLYLPNNPVYKGALDAVRGAFAPIWKHTDEFALRFTETEVRWFGHPVLAEQSKSADSLPWTFYKDGIREIQLSEGFEQDELVKFLEILQRVRKASPEEDDLLTMLWEADFTTLRYRYVDLGGEPTAALETEAPPDNVSPDEVRGAAREAAEQPNAIVNMQDFDATLYFLDEKELGYLQREIEHEYQSDLRRVVVAGLFDIYEAQQAPAIRAEVAELLENMILMLLAAGQLRTVAFVLAESRVALERAPGITGEQRVRLGGLPERLSATEPLTQLLQSLDEAADLPPQAELSELFEQLRPSALATILAKLPTLQNQTVRALVEQSADRLASANMTELVKLIGSSNRDVALQAIRRAGSMKTAAAVLPISKLLAGASSVDVRQAAVQALSAIGSAGALQALEKSIDDPDRDVRVTTVRTLGAKAYRGAFARLDTAVKAKAIRGADLTEKMAFFEAYGAMCGDTGVAFLDGILNGKGLFGKREEAELRACAAIALGKIGSKRALEALQRASSEKDIVVRNAVSRAVRGGLA